MGFESLLVVWFRVAGCQDHTGHILPGRGFNHKNPSGIDKVPKPWCAMIEDSESEIEVTSVKVV